MESKSVFFFRGSVEVGRKYPIIYDGFKKHHPQVVGNGMDLNHQPTVSRIMFSQQFMVDTVYTSKKLSHATSNLFGPSNTTGDEPVFKKKHHFC